jgi:leucyl aminopeptidase
MILTQSKPRTKHVIHLIRKSEIIKIKGLTGNELNFINKRLRENVEVVPVFKDQTLKIIGVLPKGDTAHESLEKTRLLGYQICQICNELKISSASVVSEVADASNILAFCEGFVLSNYQFLKYKTGKTTYRGNSMKALHLDKKKIQSKAVKELNALLAAVYRTRDFVNEPLSYLTAAQYSTDMKALGKECGFKVTVYSQKRIEQMRMGGILAVNKGSVQPATFNILEFKPPKAVNSQPVVLVGKGVVFDTGGLSLKPTLNSMDKMKCDMGGSAVVVGTMMALASNKVNMHVIGLIPAVENRPGGDAIVPGDVITMYDKTTVEVMNTDAEGRLILADALAYAKSLDPMLVMDFATLTGAAARAIGPHGIALMAKCDKKIKDMVMLSAEQTYERLVEFPLWKEYGDMLESTIADIKNLGGGSAGAITAGKFLEHFTDYPWMHFDIAGTAFFTKELNYRGINGTGSGVRLIYNFIKSLSTK